MDRRQRRQLHALAYNLANFMRTLALPEAIAHWSLTSLSEKLVKIGATIVTHARYGGIEPAAYGGSRMTRSTAIRIRETTGEVRLVNGK